MFPTIVQPEHSTHLFLGLIDGARAHRTACGAFFVGEVDFKAVGILVADPRLGERRIGPIAKSRHVPREHIIARFTRDDPISGQKAHAARLAEPRNDPVATEIVAQFRCRAEQHVGVG